jgi:hypothetical protein
MRGQASAFFLLRTKDKGIIAYWYRMSMIIYKWFGCCGMAGCLLELASGKTGGQVFIVTVHFKSRSSGRAKDWPPKFRLRDLRPGHPPATAHTPAEQTDPN